jgi:Rrf2 family iron-sulfur cluster assembly transcriptional regulator
LDQALAAHYKLSPRHLAPMLQALMRDCILKGIRGPHGGYELDRERRRISGEDILRSAGWVEDAEDPPLSTSNMMLDVVRTALAEAKRAFAMR